MKKNKLLKTGALALGTVASIAAPIAAVVSCGSSTDYSHTVVIKYTWAANGPQIKALQPVVDYYNKNVAKANDFKVKLVHVEGGYGKAVELDQMDMHMNNMNPVADAIIDYPDSLGTLGSKALNFGGDMASDFADSKYLTTSMEGQSATNAAFSLPLAKSTEMLSIDIPFMAALEDKGVVNLSGKVKTEVDAYRPDNKAEIDAIAGKLTTDNANTTDITDDVLGDYDQLFAAGDAISNSLKNTNGKAAKLHIIGEDAPTNLFYQLYNAKAGYNMDKFLFNDEKTPGTFSYKALQDAGSTGGILVNEILKNINTHIGSGSLVLNGSGAYSSSNFINHALPFVVGSTAGYDHNFKGQAAFGVKDGTEIVNLSGYNKEIVAPTVAKANGGAIAVTPDKYHNGVYVKDKTHTGANHEIAVTTAEGTLITNALTPTANKAIALKQYGKTADQTDAIKAAGDTAISGDYAYKVVIGQKVHVAPSKDAAHVNANEVLSLPAPNKSGVPTGSAKPQIISQGPSFIGIKHSAEKDAQTIKFMKWFFGTTSKITDADGNTSSPIDSFDQASGYITPVKDAFNIKNRSKYTKGNLVAFDAFAAIGTSGIPFDNPVTKHSSAVRKDIESTLKAMYTDYDGSGHVNDAATLYDTLEADLHMELNNN